MPDEVKVKGREPLKKREIIALYQTGMSKKDITKQLDTYYGYVQSTIKEFKLKQELADLHRKLDETGVKS